VRRRLPSLSALRAFEAAGRQLSFSRAADELFVTQSAISRQIRALEDDLGTLLFRRFNRRLELTETGARYLATMKDCFHQMEDATVRIRQKPSRDQLNLSVLPTLAIRWLVPRLPSFTEAHPDIDVRMSMSAASIDFNRDEVDIAIRVGRTDQFSEEVGGNELARVKATALFPDVLVPVCSGEVLRGGPQIKTLDDLRGHVLLHTTTRRNAWAEWFHGMGAPPIVSPHEIWYGHFFMTHQAACEGKGIAMLPMIFVSEDLSSGRLVKAIDTPVVSSECYYMVYQEHLSSSRSVSLFRSWIQAESREPLEFADSLV
jgi:LysR family transcriptional regulator, glycine cleavage system transcriptional activator